LNKCCTSSGGKNDREIRPLFGMRACSTLSLSSSEKGEIRIRTLAVGPGIVSAETRYLAASRYVQN
jgi:hypothetical protein